MRRPYSLALAPHEARESGTLEMLVGIDAMWVARARISGASRRGWAVEVEGPVGSFHFPNSRASETSCSWPAGQGSPALRAMMHDALARGERWAVSVVYSARTADEFAYGDELRALAKTRRIQLWQTVTREPAQAWTGRRGRIALHHLEEMVQDPETLCFVCGPHALVEDVPRLLQQAGVAPGRIRTEDWGR